MNSRRKTYDLVVLGGGPAGISGAATAAALGRTVALVDNHHELGGAGINTGTVPSKTLRETALTLSGARARRLSGIDLSLKRDATVSDFLQHERAVKASLNAMFSGQLEDSGAVLYNGTGIFEDSHTIRIIGNDTPGSRGLEQAEALDFVTGTHILIATGSSPVRPDIFPFESPGVYDSDTILDLNRLPRTLGVVGAGTIGCEYASIFAELHIQVHVVDSRNAVLPFLDSEIGNALTGAMKRNGIVFHFNDRVASCRSGVDCVTLTLASGASLRLEAVFIAAGRKSNTDSLNLQAAGVPVGTRGLINVDQHYQTQVRHIYAAGDVIGPPALASTSMEQARRAMRHAFGNEPVPQIPASLPIGVYTIPEIGMIGETEDALKEKGIEYTVGRAFYDKNARGKIIGDEDGMLKLLVRRGDQRLIGVHAIGEQATELVHIGLIAMLADCSAQIFDQACFNVPTLGQLYKTAALRALSCS